MSGYCLDCYGESNLGKLLQQWDDLGEEPEEILEFLNSSKNNMSLGFALRRYLCRDAVKNIPEIVCTYLQSEKKYRFDINEKKESSVIEVWDYNIFNYDGEVVKELEKIQEEDVLNLDVEKYAELFMVIQRLHNVEKKKYHTLKWIEKQEVRNYLRQEKTHRKIVFRIAFALGMEYEIARMILEGVSSDGMNGPDPRKCEEMIYTYCLGTKRNTFEELEQISDAYCLYKEKKEGLTEELQENFEDRESQKKQEESDTLGIFLRRYLCIAASKNIPEICDNKGEEEKYVELFVEIQQLHNIEKKKYSPLEWITKQEVRHYLQQKKTHRKNIFRMAFALGMEYETVRMMLERLSSDEIDDAGKYEEMIYLDCLKKGNNTFAGVEQMSKSYNGHEENKAYNTKNYTINTMGRLESFIQDGVSEEAFCQFLYENEKHFYGASRSAYDVFNRLYECALRQYGNLEKNESRDALEENSDNKKRTENTSEMVRAFEGNLKPYIMQLETVKGPYVKSLESNILNTSVLSKILSRKLPVTKHHIMYLYYCCFIKEDEQKVLPEYDRVNIFYDQVNDYLEEAVMPPVDITNKFENFLLQSLLENEPAELWKRTILKAIRENVNWRNITDSLRKKEAVWYQNREYQPLLEALNIMEESLKDCKDLLDERLLWEHLWIYSDKASVCAMLFLEERKMEEKVKMKENAKEYLEKAIKYYNENKAELKESNKQWASHCKKRLAANRKAWLTGNIQDMKLL